MQYFFEPHTQFIQFPARYAVTSQIDIPRLLRRFECAAKKNQARRAMGFCPIDNPVEVGLAESHKRADLSFLSRTLVRLFAQQDSKVAIMKQSLCRRAGLGRECSIRDTMKTMRHPCMWPPRNFALSQPSMAVAVLFQATAH